MDNFKRVPNNYGEGDEPEPNIPDIPEEIRKAAEVTFDFDAIDAGDLPKHVKKEILIAGKDLILYEPGTKVTFHYRAEIFESKKFIDDTKEFKRPFELVLGKKFRLEIWEAMVKSMKLGEVARFFVPRYMTIHYPSVAKALRDTDRESKGEKVPAKQCCGMMNQTQTCGYEDLDELFKKPKDIVFTFEILKIEPFGTYDCESWQLNPEQKLASLAELKEKGNELLKEGKIEEAKKKYHESLSRLEELQIREKPGCEEYNILQNKKVPFLLNYSLCLMKMEEFYQATDHLNMVLFIDAVNPKALLRRARCNRILGEFEAANVDLLRIIAIDDSYAKDVADEFALLQKEMIDKKRVDKDAFKRLFDPSIEFP